MLIDMKLLKQVLYVSCTILKKNFFYDEDAILRFLHHFEKRVMDGYIHLEEVIDEDARRELTNDYMARSYFSSYFVSEHLSACLYLDCNFTESELILLDNMLPKYAGDTSNDTKSSKQGTNNRKLSKGL